MSHKKQEIQEDLRKWVQEKWVDIGAPDGKGGYKPCGRSKGEKRKGYPKCVPAAKARSMSKGEKRSAVKRKRAAGNAGPKPTMVKTKIREQRMQSLQEKLCARGKAAAKRKFRVYPSAYANLYGSAVCSGKVTPGGKKKKKKKSRKNESSYYNIGLVILETLERIKGKGGFSKAKTNPDPRTAPTTKALFGKTSKAQRRKLGKEELPSGAESLTPQTGKIPGPKPGEKPGREDSHTVYHDMGMVIAEMMGLVKNVVKAAAKTKAVQSVAKKVGQKVVDSGNKKIKDAETGEASGQPPRKVRDTAMSGHRRLKIGQAIKSIGDNK